jgi:hypothetical protein
MNDKANAGDQTPEAERGFDPDEFAAFAARIDQLARAEYVRQRPNFDLIFQCRRAVDFTSAILDNLCDRTAKKENWPTKRIVYEDQDQDGDEDDYEHEWVMPENWQHAIDTVKKIENGLYDLERELEREHDERRRAERRRVAAEKKEKSRKLKQLERARARVRALEGEAGAAGGGDE